MSAIDLDEFNRLTRQEGHLPIDKRAGLMLHFWSKWYTGRWATVFLTTPRGVSFQQYTQNVYAPPPLDQ